MQELRKDYSRANLDITSVSKNPIDQFEKWFAESQQAGISEPNAMALATVSADGRPSVRMVLLKGIEDGCFVFYTNYQSRKGIHLDTNPACALTFFWPELERQIRIEGVASKTSKETATAYFQSRPRGSQLGAWASPQSLPIQDRNIIEERLQHLEKKFENTNILPKPEQWGGYKVVPHLIEFWQGRPNRLHDRIEFVKTDTRWEIHRLAP